MNSTKKYIKTVGMLTIVLAFIISFVGAITTFVFAIRFFFTNEWVRSLISIGVVGLLGLICAICNDLCEWFYQKYKPW